MNPTNGILDNIPPRECQLSSNQTAYDKILRLSHSMTHSMHNGSYALLYCQSKSSSWPSCWYSSPSSSRQSLPTQLHQHICAIPSSTRPDLASSHAASICPKEAILFKGMLHPAFPNPFTASFPFCYQFPVECFLGMATLHMLKCSKRTIRSHQISGSTVIPWQS